MPIQFKRNIFATGGSLRVNIPSEIADALALKAGDTMLISLTDSQIIMQKGKR
jgi:antitoxin component of MazEF toxin-antitoxin module